MTWQQFCIRAQRHGWTPCSVAPELIILTKSFYRPNHRPRYIFVWYDGTVRTSR
jgi:hypothetical protein